MPSDGHCHRIDERSFHLAPAVAALRALFSMYLAH
jgi:hypothetical protein